MSELAAADSGSNATEYTVSEISGALKRTVEDAFGHVRVRGEISGYRGPHSSGHAYFALKDERSRLEAVIWKGTFARLAFRPEEGMEVVATGRLTTYPGSSKYQIVIDNLEPAGAGALMALLEERKRRLAAEGLFDKARKRPLPYMPRVIGVVTSPTGAVIRDILHRITDRFPLHILVWPVRVQGETTGAEVSAAIVGFNALPRGGPIPRPDVLIVARGGGSLEDLWGFNDEAVARAAAASAIPLIAAVGHETDWTLIDFAADQRAPTPTGAAELAVPVKAELEATLASLAARLKASLSRQLDRQRQTLRAAARALPSPDQLLAGSRRRFDEAAGRLERALFLGVERKRARLGGVRLSPAGFTQRIGQGRRAAERDLLRAQSALRAIVRARRGEAQRAAEGLPRTVRSTLALRRQRVVLARGRLSLRPLLHAAERARDRLAVASRRHEKALAAGLDRLGVRLGQAERLLASLSLSEQAILERGYAVVLDAAGTVVKRAAAIHGGQALELRFADGAAHVLATGEAREAQHKTGRRRGDAGSGTDQGSLF